MYLLHILRKHLRAVSLIYILIVVLAIFVITLNLLITTENIFSVLSWQFLKGYLWLPELVGDAVFHGGLYYWPLGPFPAAFLMPFSFITKIFLAAPMPQGVINILLIIGIFYLLYKISISFGFNKENSVWLSTAVIFASVFCLSAFLPWSWYFSQTITFFFGVLAFHEYIGRKRPFLIGIFHAFMFMTRFTAGFGIIFYILDALLLNVSLKSKVRSCLLMLLPIVLSGMMLLWYNYARFGKIMDNGYQEANNWVQESEIFRYELLHYGLFNFNNIPTNFYYYFLNMPSPVLEKVVGFERSIYKTESSLILHLVPPYIKVSSPGVSFFVVSPIFFLIFKNNLKSKKSRLAALTCVFILFFLLTYYWTGWTQIGPRYLIDMLPFLVILLLESFKTKQVNIYQRFLIFCSVIFNIFLFYYLFFTSY